MVQLDPGRGAVAPPPRSTAASWRLPHLGGHHVEDPLPDLLQLARVVLASELEEHRSPPARGSRSRHGTAGRRPPPRSPAPAPRAPHPTSAPSRPRVLLERPPQRQVAPRLAPRRPWSRTASHAAASRSPCASATSSDAPSTRASSASSCERTSVSATSADCFSATDMNAGSTDATPFSAAPRSSAHSMIGCTGPPPRTHVTDTAPGPGGAVRRDVAPCATVAIREPLQRHPASTTTGSMDDCPDPGILVASDGIRSGSACSRHRTPVRIQAQEQEPRRSPAAGASSSAA